MHPDSDAVMLLTGGVGGLLNIFLFCFFGKLATVNFDQMPNCLYESAWLNLPVELQKSFIFMISNAQIPFFYNGLGIMILNLETFATVSLIQQYKTSEM